MLLSTFFYLKGTEELQTKLLDEDELQESDQELQESELEVEQSENDLQKNSKRTEPIEQELVEVQNPIEENEAIINLPVVESGSGVFDIDTLPEPKQRKKRGRPPKASLEL